MLARDGIITEDLPRDRLIAVGACAPVIYAERKPDAGPL
jgi:hypothetical protein